MNLKIIAQCNAVVLGIVLFSSGALATGAAYRLHIDGLACPFCAYGIEKKLNAITGVERLETSIKDGTVSVTMKDGIVLDEAMAGKAVKEAGFSLRKFERVLSP